MPLVVGPGVAADVPAAHPATATVGRKRAGAAGMQSAESADMGATDMFASKPAADVTAAEATTHMSATEATSNMAAATTAVAAATTAVATSAPAPARQGVG
jgi:hypothetical protein